MTERRIDGDGPLSLRPHHILDIVRNIGNGREIKPHPYGHLVHAVTESLLRGTDRECRLVVGADDICGPCIHLSRDGLCDDVSVHRGETVSKRTYNDALDRRLLAFFGLRDGCVLPLADYLGLAAERLEELAPLCAHPDEDREYRRRGLIEGLRVLRISRVP